MLIASPVGLNIDLLIYQTNASCLTFCYISRQLFSFPYDPIARAKNSSLPHMDASRAIIDNSVAMRSRLAPELGEGTAHPRVHVESLQRIQRLTRPLPQQALQRVAPAANRGFVFRNRRSSGRA